MNEVVKETADGMDIPSEFKRTEQKQARKEDQNKQEAPETGTVAG